jgi:hypothetical protein
VLADVSPFDRAVALSLAECSATQTSLTLGVSRATVYRSIERLTALLLTLDFHREGANKQATGSKPQV